MEGIGVRGEKKGRGREGWDGKEEGKDEKEWRRGNGWGNGTKGKGERE